MARYVIDAQTLLHVVETGTALDPQHQLVAPASIRSQALELLLVRVQRGGLDEADALRAHERLTEAKIRVLNDRVSRRSAWNLAREQGWTSLRDAEYLALTKLQADALVTIDDRLAELASGLVALAPLSAVLAD